MLGSIMMVCTSVLNENQSLSNDEHPLLLQQIANHEGIAVGVLVCSPQHISAIYKGIGSRKWIKRGELGRGSIAALPPSHPCAEGRYDLLGIPLSPVGVIALDTALKNAMAGTASLSGTVGEELAMLLQVACSSHNLGQEFIS